MNDLWLILHYAGIVVFVAAHGAQMWMMMALRSAYPNRDRMSLLAEISKSATPPMYVALVVLVFAGVAAGVQEGLTDGWWMWAALGVLLIEIGLMAAFASPYMRKVRDATTQWADGSYAMAEDEFDQLIHGPQVALVTWVGIAGLAIILWLMVYKPGSSA